MTRRLILVALFGLCGVGALVALGTWQVQRLAWKQGLIAQLETRLAAAPVALPAAPDPDRDAYLRVALDGAFEAGEAFALGSTRRHGPGFRVIAPFVTEDGRRVLVDRGFVPEADRRASRPTGPARVVGALYWPNETDGFTPDPDLAANLWFARDAESMARALGTEPLMIVADAPTGGAGAPEPVPVGVNLRNDHLQYAITWYGMAAAWAVLSLMLARREARRTS